jgi:hypothetical protein
MKSHKSEKNEYNGHYIHPFTRDVFLLVRER